MSVKINFPTPSARPGDIPDFSNYKFPDPGVLSVPPLEMTAEESREYANSLIRVLDKEGNAVGPWAEYLGEEGLEDALLQGLRDMLQMRAIDARMLNAQRQGKTTFYLQCTGEEAIGCAFQKQLHPGDMNFPTYRQQSLLVASGYPLKSLFGQYYQNENDPLSGRQLPTLHSAKDYGFFTISGNLGTQYVQAVGWAMAAALTGTDNISAAWIGDGATASNDYHSAMVTAAVYNPPVILNVVNNQWAISSFSGIAGGSASTFASRGVGYGIPSIRVDGNDFLAVMAATKWATKRARGGYGPVVIEWVTYRVAAHSTSDDASAYRPKEEADAWPLGDPVERLKQHLISRGKWSEARHKQGVAEIMDEVIAAQKESEALGTFLNPQYLSPSAIFEGVYEEMPEHLKRQRQDMGA